MALTGSPDGMRTRGRPRSGIEDSSKIDIKRTVWEDVNWIRVL
jgi:hypothetical protein